MTRMIGRVPTGGCPCVDCSPGDHGSNRLAKRREQRVARREILDETPPQPCEWCGTMTLDWRANGWFCSWSCVRLWALELDAALGGYRPAIDG